MNFKKFRNVLFVIILAFPIAGMCDEFFNRSPNISDLLNKKELLTKILTLKDKTYSVSSVNELDVEIDDGTREYEISFTPILDGYLSCEIVVEVTPYLSDEERTSIVDDNCPLRTYY